MLPNIVNHASVNCVHLSVLIVRQSIVEPIRRPASPSMIPSPHRTVPHSLPLHSISLRNTFVGGDASPTYIYAGPHRHKIIIQCQAHGLTHSVIDVIRNFVVIMAIHCAIHKFIYVYSTLNGFRVFPANLTFNSGANTRMMYVRTMIMFLVIIRQLILKSKCAIIAKTTARQFQ